MHAGPSYTDKICPPGEPLGSFDDNTAHSNVRYGVRIFNQWVPVAGDGCSWNDAAARENPSPAIFNRYTAYKNGRTGAYSMLSILNCFFPSLSRTKTFNLNMKITIRDQTAFKSPMHTPCMIHSFFQTLDPKKDILDRKTRWLRFIVHAGLMMSLAGDVRCVDCNLIDNMRAGAELNRMAAPHGTTGTYNTIIAVNTPAMMGQEFPHELRDDPDQGFTYGWFDPPMKTYS
jgi:hypothetical protein